MDGQCPVYFSHAIAALSKIMKENEIPDEKLVMWY